MHTATHCTQRIFIIRLTHPLRNGSSDACKLLCRLFKKYFHDFRICFCRQYRQLNQLFLLCQFRFNRHVLFDNLELFKSSIFYRNTLINSVLISFLYRQRDLGNALWITIHQRTMRQMVDIQICINSFTTDLADQRRQGARRTRQQFPDVVMRYHRAFCNPVGEALKRPGQLTGRQRTNHAATAFQRMKGAPRINQVILEVRTTHPGRKQRIQLDQLFICLFQED